jgi:hypothetical protein
MPMGFLKRWLSGNGVWAWGVWGPGMISLVRSFTFLAVMPINPVSDSLCFDFRIYRDINSILRVFRFLLCSCLKKLCTGGNCGLLIRVDFTYSNIHFNFLTLHLTFSKLLNIR